MSEFYHFKKLQDEYVTVGSHSLFVGINNFTRQLPIIRHKFERLSSTIEQIKAFLTKNIREHETTLSQITENGSEATDFVYAYLQEIDRRKRIGESIENYRYSFTK